MPSMTSTPDRIAAVRDGSIIATFPLSLAGLIVSHRWAALQPRVRLATATYGFPFTGQICPYGMIRDIIAENA